MIWADGSEPHPGKYAGSHGLSGGLDGAVKGPGERRQGCLGVTTGGPELKLRVTWPGCRNIPILPSSVIMTLRLSLSVLGRCEVGMALVSAQAD